MKKIIVTGTLALFFVSAHAFDLKNLCSTLDIHVHNNGQWISQLNQYATISNAKALMTKVTKNNMPLFDSYPLLQTLPHVTLCNLPTSIQQLNKLGAHLNTQNLWIKRDDVTGILYGGNKPRKLEFELGNALKQGADAIITFGCAGSNHAVACSEYARMLGLKPICMLKPQKNSHTVRKNLLLHQTIGTELHYYPDNETRKVGTVSHWLDIYNQMGKFAYIIPTGGSTPLGTVGFVNAAFELKKQIDNGVMPAPDYIYLPCGSAATTAGLLLGCTAVGLTTKIVAVAIEPEDKPNQLLDSVVKLFHEANELLHETDPSFMVFECPMQNLEIKTQYAGPNYAEFTPECMEAYHLLKEHENILIDGTYTGKALAALIADAQANKTNESVVLFWNTYCGLDVSHRIAHADYKKLPKCFHAYFEEPVQKLDTTL